MKKRVEVKNEELNGHLVILFRASFYALFSLAIIAAVHPETRLRVRSLFSVQSRTVLSTVQGNLLDDGTPIKVVKVKTKKGIFLEIYGQTRENLHPLLDRIKLPDNKDGFFLFNGEATNLAIKDINGDSTLEILVPSFDANLTAHLNVYGYDKVLKKFRPISE